MKAMRQAAVDRWRALAPRERTALKLAAAVLGPALLVFGIGLPVGDSLRRLETRSALLARQLAEMRDMRDWLKAGAAADAPAPAPASELATRLEAELAALPGFRGSVRVAEEHLDVRVDSAPFDGVVLWLERAQARDAVFPLEVRLAALPDAGRVGGRIRLARGGA